MKKILSWCIIILSCFLWISSACSNGAINDPICDQCSLGMVLSWWQCIATCPQPLPMFNTTLCFNQIKVQSLAESFSNVNFIWWGNNFGGGFFWLPRKSLSSKMNILLWTQSRQCGQQIRWMYYNNQRGQRLWPLDNDTLNIFKSNDSSYTGLIMNGWLYTACSGGTKNDIYSVYGQISYSWVGTGSLTAGVWLDSTGNTLLTGFASNFQYFDNKTPLWYVYDTNGGIGFIGGLLDISSWHQELINFLNTTWVNNVFNLRGGVVSIAGPSWIYTVLSGNGEAWKNTVWNFFVRGVTSLGKILSSEDRKTVLGNPKNAGTIVNANAISSSELLNIVSKKASALCKWVKTYSVSQFSSSLPVWIICIKDTLPRKSIQIDLALDSYYDKVFVVSNVDVVLKNSMTNFSKPLNLFVDRWNVYVHSVMIGSWIYFDAKGYPSGIGFQWVFLKWNIIVNGLLLGTWSQGTEYNRRLVFHGKISTLNTPLEPQQWRITQVKNALWEGFNNTINIQNVFAWQCDVLSGIGSDGTLCDGTGELIRSPLILIDRTWKSILLE